MTSLEYEITRTSVLMKAKEAVNLVLLHANIRRLRMDIAVPAITAASAPIAAF